MNYTKTKLLMIAASLFFAADFASATNLTNLVAKDRGVDDEQAKECVNSVFTGLTSELREGREVAIRGFGKFYLQERDTRKARNPKTGEEVIVPARKYPRFTSSDVLKRKVN